MSQANQFGCTDLTQTISPSYIGVVAPNASSSWIDSRGDAADSATYGRLRFPSRAALLLVFSTNHANNNFSLQGSNSSSGADPVNLVKPSVSSAATHAVDIVELPTHLYRYFRVSNAAGSNGSVQIILLRYNDRDFRETAVKIFNDSGNIYRYTGATS